MLNGQQMGGKRRSAHYFDLWNIKYLPKFKWDHLTEEVNYQKAVHEQRLAAEVAAATRERDFYMSRVDKAKGVEAIVERKKRKRQENGQDDENNGGGGRDGPKVLRSYGQRKSKADPVNDEGAPTLSRGLLKMIAGAEKK